LNQVWPETGKLPGWRCRKERVSAWRPTSTEIGPCCRARCDWLTVLDNSPPGSTDQRTVNAKHKAQHFPPSLSGLSKTGCLAICFLHNWCLPKFWKSPLVSGRSAHHSSSTAIADLFLSTAEKDSSGYVLGAVVLTLGRQGCQTGGRRVRPDSHRTEASDRMTVLRPCRCRHNRRSTPAVDLCKISPQSLSPSRSEIIWAFHRILETSCIVCTLL
jgi:hypothetical protein